LHGSYRRRARDPLPFPPNHPHLSASSYVRPDPTPRLVTFRKPEAWVRDPDDLTTSPQVIRIPDAWQRVALSGAAVSAFRAAGLVPYSNRDNRCYLKIGMSTAMTVCHWSSAPHVEGGREEARDSLMGKRIRTFVVYSFGVKKCARGFGRPPEED
jgi:hypothetical protein